MIELTHFPMKLIDKKDILKNNEISWIIKYDLLNATEVYEIDIDINDLNRFSDKIMFMRKYNKENAPSHKFLFNLYTNKVFYIVKTTIIDYSKDNIYYNDETLEYSYGRREEKIIG